MENQIINIITNSIGAVSTAILFLIYIDRQDKRQTILIENHLRHSTEAINKMSNAITKLSGLIKSLHLLLKSKSG